MDVSAYLVNAAMQQIAEEEAIEAQFAHIDAEIAKAEAEAASLPDVPEATDADLTDEERREVKEALDLVFGAERRNAHLGGSVGESGQRLSTVSGST